MAAPSGLPVPDLPPSSLTRSWALPSYASPRCPRCLASEGQLFGGPGACCPHPAKEGCSEHQDLSQVTAVQKGCPGCVLLVT